MIIWVSDKWEKEIIFRQSKYVFIMQIIRILFLLFLLFFIIFLFLNYKQEILSLSFGLYILIFIWILTLINFFFIFVLFEFIKYFFWINMLVWDLFSMFRVWKLFSDNIDFINLDDIWDFKFSKTNILEILFDFWKVILDDNELNWKVLDCVGKPEKIVELLAKEKKNGNK